MPHPDVSRRPRRTALAGGVGALLLLTAPAGAVLGEEVALTCEAASGTVAGLDVILDPACEAVEGVGAPVEEAVAPVVDAVPSEVTAPVGEILAPVAEILAPVAEVVPAPVADALPAPEAAPEGGGSGTPEPPSGGEASSGDAAAPPASSDGEAAVAAAGKEPVEVSEPRGPAAQGRVTGPTIQPTVPGSNTAGIASQSGLTLQPFEATPLVSIPTVLDQPMVAGSPVTMSSPVAAVAAGALDFAGDLVLPQTSGQAFLLTTVGLGLVAATGTTLRRRFGGTTTLDVEI